jgi:radical SAM family uncharacterized protein
MKDRGWVVKSFREDFGLRMVGSIDTYFGASWMQQESLKAYLLSHVIPRVQMPAQYLGGEWNMVRKDPAAMRGRLCLAFPDAYEIGTSHHGFQVLYSLMNARDDWYCERVFAPWLDMEQAMRQAGLPWYSLETFTPLADFDVVGFSLQYELSYINMLTMLDLGRIPLDADQRTAGHPLILAGGPSAQNPEPLAPFVDAFVLGDGEVGLPEVCEVWRDLLDDAASIGGLADGQAGCQQREQLLAELVVRLPYVYVPRFYKPEYQDGRFLNLNRLRSEVPEAIEPALSKDLDAIPLPTRPIVPFVQTVHDRISIEIMRGCPWQCRFCQSTAIKRPVRVRSVSTIVDAALETYRNTGFNEISLLALSSSDYPHFEELVVELRRIFNPLGVNISVPSLRVNEQLRTLATLIGNDRRAGLTLAPEVARDDMREQIRKKIKNDDLYEGCRNAFRQNYQRVKLYFMCGLPGERPVDLDGIVEMAETISRIGREERGRPAQVTASVSNFIPKAHTPYQWNAMQRREYFRWAHDYLRGLRQLRSVSVKCHDIETSLLEGVISRGDRRVGQAIRLAWQRGARLDSWREHFQPQRWWTALDDAGIDYQRLLHEPYSLHDRLPWDHVHVKYGRNFLESEQTRSVVQLESMAVAR